MKTGAISRGDYRFRLWRQWDRGLSVLFIMLNPSTAGAREDDPTLRRCISFAQDWGYAGLEVVNLFALRSTDPALLRDHADPIGPSNDRFIRNAAGRHHEIVVAWGHHGSLQGRDEQVLALLSKHRLSCLGVTRSGQPRHPLYLKRGAPRQTYSR